MSNKQVRRYVDGLKAKAEDDEANKEESSDSVDGRTEASASANSFAFLMESAVEETSRENSEGKEEIGEATASVAKSRRKKKKNKKKGGVKSPNPSPDSGSPEPLLRTDSSEPYRSPRLLQADIFKVTYRGLNAETEVRNLAGERAPQGPPGHRFVPSPKIVSRNPRWPELRNTGLSMVLDEENNSVLYFKFVHGKRYKTAQNIFWAAPMVGDVYQQILAEYPFHLDSLLMVADILRLQENLETSFDLTERGIYACVNALAPRFQLTDFNHRIRYEVFENRAFFLLLHQHLHALLCRHLYSTALNVAKLLFSLDPDGDPLAILLSIDMIALEACDYEFIIHLYDNMKDSHNLDSLPNFSYSVALAHFMMASEGRDQMQVANEYLEKAILHFPTLVIPLFEKLQIPIGKELDNKYMNAAAQQREVKGVRRLLDVYIDMCSEIWRKSDVVEWLDNIVNKILAKLSAYGEELSEWDERRHARFVGIPRNVERHALLWSAVNRNTPWVTVDPAPPFDGVTSYREVDRVAARPLVRTFISSILPDWNLEDGNQQ